METGRTNLVLRTLPRRVVSVAAVLAGLLITSQHASATTFTYTPTAAPTVPFGMFDKDVTNGNAPTGTPVVVASNTLSVGPTSTTGYDFLGFSGAFVALNLNQTETIQVSATLKLDAESTLPADVANRAGLGMGFTDSGNDYTELYINSTGVFLNGPGRLAYESPVAVGGADGTADFHTYMLQLSAGIVSVYVDGTQVITGGVMFTPPAGDQPTQANSAAVGDITSDSNSTYDLTSFSVAVVPEPASAAIIFSGLALLGTRRRAPKLRA
jgi:hypothetical protein